MARKKQRTKEQKELALNALFNLMRQGLSKSEAAKQLGLHRNQVYRDWEEVTHRLNEDSEKNLLVMLAQYGEVKAQAWAAWEQSKENKERTVVKKITKAGSNEQNGSERLQVVKVTEGRLPNNSFLETIRKILDKECELRGLNPPKNMNLTVHELDQAIEAELARLAEGRSSEVAGAIPPYTGGAQAAA